jgi:hypothetical protein
VAEFRYATLIANSGSSPPLCITKGSQEISWLVQQFFPIIFGSLGLSWWKIYMGLDLKLITCPESNSESLEISFQKDPGKNMENNFGLTSVRNHKPEFYPATHQIAPHHQNMHLLEPPDSSQSWVEPLLIIGKTGIEKCISINYSMNITKKIIITNSQFQLTLEVNLDQDFIECVPSSITPSLSKVRKKMRKKQIRYIKSKSFFMEMTGNIPVASSQSFNPRQNITRHLKLVVYCVCSKGQTGKKEKDHSIVLKNRFRWFVQTQNVERGLTRVVVAFFSDNGDGEIKIRLFSSFTDNFGLIFQASCVGSPITTGIFDCLDQEARKLSVRLQSQKRRTTDEQSVFMTKRWYKAGGPSQTETLYHSISQNEEIIKTDLPFQMANHLQ